MAVLSPHLSIITLNMNGLNSAIKTEWLGAFKNKTELCAYPSSNNKHRLELKGDQSHSQLLQRLLSTKQEMSMLSRMWVKENPCTLLVLQSLSRAQLLVIPWTAAHQTSPSFTISQRLLRLTFIKSVMPSNHLIFCYPFLFLPSTFPRIGVFSNESVLCIRWPKYWSFS